jgi:hypothetical protein
MELEITVIFCTAALIGIGWAWSHMYWLKKIRKLNEEYESLDNFRAWGPVSTYEPRMRESIRRADRLISKIRLEEVKYLSYELPKPQLINLKTGENNFQNLFQKVVNLKKCCENSLSIHA